MVKSPNSLEWLQLVKTPDNELTGQLEKLVLKPDGRVEPTHIDLTGVVDGENVILTTTILGIRTATLGGTLKGSTLTLRWNADESIVMLRADPDSFANEKKSLEIHAQKIASAKQAVAVHEKRLEANIKLVSTIDLTVARMRAFVNDYDPTMSRIHETEERFRSITTKISSLVDRERQLRNPGAGVARSQIVVAINQGQIASQQLNFAVNPFRFELRNSIGPMARSIDPLTQSCGVSDDELPRAENISRQTACKKLSQAKQPFMQSYESITNALTQLERTYAEESKKQEHLIEASLRLQ